MTVTAETPTPIETVTFDLYRDVHKGIRGELFAVTGEAGKLDPANRAGRVALAGHVGRVVDLLVSHAAHEDAGVQPTIAAHLPDAAARIAEEHATLEGRMDDLRALALTGVDTGRGAQRSAIHRTYVELAAFTSAYLAHQDFEERVVMPALEAAIGVEAVLGIHRAVVGSMAPDEMATGLAIMLPAMNVDDRAELLGGMQANAPADVFAGVWGLAASVLTPADHAQLALRLGIASR